MNRYSQNFILNKNIIENLLTCSSISPGSTVLDIGAGDGSITIPLSQHIGTDGKIFAIENDSSLVKKLKINTNNLKNVKIIEQDVLKYNFPQSDFTSFSNIPFNLTSEIILRLIKNQYFKTGYFVVQKEAGFMFGGTQVNSYPTLKSLLLFPFYTLTIFHRFSKQDFTPSPNVDIIMIKLESKNIINRSLFGDFETFVSVFSRDRVGEGIWKNEIDREEMHDLFSKTGLINQKGIKAQKEIDFLKIFNILMETKGKTWFKNIQKYLNTKEIKKIHRTRRAFDWYKS